MIFIKYNSSGLVTLQHFKPDQLNSDVISTGVLVESVPQPLEQENKNAVLYYDEIQELLYYKYEDILSTSKEKENTKIAELEQKIQQQNQAIADLTVMISTLQAPQA